MIREHGRLAASQHFVTWSLGGGGWDHEYCIFAVILTRHACNFFHKAQLRCGGSEVVQLTAEALVPGSYLACLAIILGRWRIIV